MVENFQKINTYKKEENIVITEKKIVHSDQKILSSSLFSIKKKQESLHEEQKYIHYRALTEEEMHQAYQDFLGSLPEEEMLKPLLQAATYQLKAPVFHFQLTSSAQMRWITGAKVQIVSFLRKKLLHPEVNISLEFITIGTPENKISAKECWNIWLAKKPELQKFINYFNLNPS